MNITRPFIGGPYHRMLRDVNEGSDSVAIPLERPCRVDPNVPEWSGYRRLGDEMHFTGRFTSAGEALAARLMATRAG